MANFRPLKTASQLKRLMSQYYLLTRLAPKLGLKTAWLTSGAPVELLISMGVIPQYPENFGALCGARKVSGDLCAVAEAHGYSPDLCSYARNDLGSVLSPDKAPLGGLSRPDLLVACNNICGTVSKWWEHLAHELKVPLFLLDLPFSEDRHPPHLIEYGARQVESLCEFLEKHTGRRFREDRFRRVVDRSFEAVTLWNEVMDLGTAKPAPLNAADRFLCMAPVVTLRGSRFAVRYYRALKREVAGRVERGEGAVEGERRRLLWDNIAIWFDIFGFFNRFAKQGFSFPVDTYTSIWRASIFDANMARGVSRVYSDIFLNQGFEVKLAIMERMMRRFDLDGFVLHSNRSCKPYSLGQLPIKEELTARTGKPGLIIDADMADPRAYDGARVASQVEAFMEMLA